MFYSAWYSCEHLTLYRSSKKAPLEGPINMLSDTNYSQSQMLSTLHSIDSCHWVMSKQST